MVNSKKEIPPAKRRRRKDQPRPLRAVVKRPPTRADFLVALSDSSQDLGILSAQILSEEVKRGELGLLLAAIESSDMSPEVKFVLIEFVTGKLKRARHRPPDPNTQFRRMYRALRVLDLERSGWTKRDAAIAQAAAELHCSRGSVEQALTEYEYLLCKESDVFIEKLRQFGPIE